MGFVFGSFDDIGFGKGDKHIEGHWHLSVRENLRQGTSRKLLVFGGCKFSFFYPDIVLTLRGERKGCKFSFFLTYRGRKTHTEIII